ncbi:MAG: response regulator FixJ [Phenylobacterium sp.]|jgi:two-component system response regulator FixJ
MPEPIVHLIDDDEAVRASVGFLLEMKDIPAATYASAEAFLAVADSLSNGCVVTDIRMPGMNGLDLARALKARRCPLPMIVITGHGDMPLAIEAMRAGVVDFLEKPFEEEALIRAIQTALAAAAPADANAEGRRRYATLLESLSTRESEVLRGVVDGKMNKVIAFELGISERTVEVYRANVMRKTQATSISDLVRIAVLAGI